MSEVPLYPVVSYLKNGFNPNVIKGASAQAFGCRGTSLIRKRPPLGSYTRTMPWDIWWP